jgi:hypothetical protein
MPSLLCAFGERVEMFAENLQCPRDLILHGLYAQSELCRDLRVRQSFHPAEHENLTALWWESSSDEIGKSLFKH